MNAVIALKDCVQESLKEGLYVALISFDIKGVFDAAWWPGILFSLKNLKCSRNPYNLSEIYFNGRKAVLIVNSRKEQREINQGCPQGSASGPGFWNLQFNSLLNLDFTKNTKVIAYADDLLILTKEIPNRKSKTMPNLS